MSDFKIAKILTTTDINSVQNNNMILQSEGGEHDGFRMYVKSNNIIRRLLPPYEEIDNYWEFNHTESDTLEEPVVYTISNGKETKFININSTLQPEYLNIYLPTVSIDGVYYTYPIRFAINQNAGFNIKLAEGDTNKIFGDRNELLVTGSNTTFEMFLSPDGVWRVLGVWYK